MSASENDPEADLDGKVSGALKTLDAESPSGYFDRLPGQVMARLEEPMQSSTSSQSGESGGSGATKVPPIAMGTSPSAKVEAAAVDANTSNEDNSGLHDIRDLARSAKLRAARNSTHPPMDEDVLASSSAGWKAVALPEPAKMVSLPALEELSQSSKQRAKAEAAAQKQALKQAKAEPKLEAEPRLDAKPEPKLEAKAEPHVPAAARAEAPSAKPQARARAARANRTTLYALVGGALAVAAIAVVFVMTSHSSAPTAPQTVAQADRAPAAAPLAPLAAPAPAPVVTAAPPDIVVPAAPAIDAPIAAPVTTTPAKHADKKPGERNDRSSEKLDRSPAAATMPAPAQPKKPDAPKAEPRKEGDPSFDDLLKEAGATTVAKAAPKLAKKELSEADIKTGMGAVASKATACYQGTGGVVPVKVSVAPSGAINRVSIGGAFAGTPTGNCVATAVKGASFPAWDGRPMTISYSYLLSE
jgi:hypothetical protein